MIQANYEISRIRNFYMRKVRFTQNTIHDKLDLLLTSFPVLTDVHPFYADLVNVLYDRDHYKLALGQLSTAKVRSAGGTLCTPPPQQHATSPHPTPPPPSVHH